MRTRACLGLLLLMALGASCDSDSPLQVGEQQLELLISSVGGRISEHYNVWLLFEDSNGDGLPDDLDGDGNPDTSLYCLPTTPQNLGVSSVPLPFTIDVSLLVAGTTEAVPITSPLALSDSDTNRAVYDTTTQTSNAFRVNEIVIHDDFVCSDAAQISCDPNGPAGYCASFPGTSATGDGGACTDEQTPGGTVTRTFLFRNPLDGGVTSRATIMSGANRTILTETSHLISELTGDTTGVCPGTDFGDPTIDALVQPFPFSLNKGDTVIVKLGRVDEALPGITFVSAPEISASLRLEGNLVNVEGESTTNGSTNAVTFSFTSR